MNRGRKISGGRYHKQKKSKLYARSGQARHATLGEPKTKQIRIRSGKMKTITLKADTINIMENGKSKQAKIINVIETPQNKFFSRQNRLLKSAIIETSLGKARITNRPNQEGQINGILIKE
ncbi:MAG: 30S ribosomal protein S8e [Nanoarchaeota archaeon]|mgnify:CR=1 FL=1